jgi:hypothetical protein
MTAAPETFADRVPATEIPAAIHLPDLAERTKKVRSGSEHRQRLHVKRCRYDDAELAAFEARARASGLTDGAFIRAATLGDAGPRAQRQRSHMPVIEAQALARNNAELNMIGSNLNQAVRALNEIALDEGNGRLAQVAHLTGPILAVLDELRLTLAANRSALGHDREG